jgi:hypothetical protein
MKARKWLQALAIYFNSYKTNIAFTKEGHQSFPTKISGKITPFQQAFLPALFSISLM